jgi:BMFP domain-containing protein YqiC
VDGTGVAGTGGGNIGGESGGGDGTGVDGTGVALTSEQVSTIVTDALALLPAYATPTDVTNAITTALEGQNNLSPTDVTNAITTALAGQKNLSDEEVGNIITKIVGSPSTTTVIDGIEVVTDPTGIYAKIQGVGNEIQTAISKLPVSPTITEITNAITTVLAGQNNLNENEVEAALKKALEGKFNLNATDIGTIVGKIVGQPSTTTTMPDGTVVVTDATGIYAEIKGVGNEIQTAISNLPVSPTITEITDAITTVLAGQNNLNENEVEAALKKALEGKFNLNATDIDTIVGGVVGHDGQLVFDENGEIVVDANGNPVYSNPTGIYAKIEGVGNEIQTAISNLPASPTITEITDAITTVLAGQNDLSDKEITTIVTDALSGMNNLSDKEVSTIVGNALSGLNNLSKTDVTTIVSDAISGLNDLSYEEVGNIITKTVGSPSTTTFIDGIEVVTDATGIYAQLEGLNNLSTDDLSTAINDAIDELPEYATPTDVTTAITTAVAALTTGALKTMQDTIDEMGRYETSEDFSVRDIVEEFKRQRKGGMGYGLPSYMQRYMSGNVIDELVREVVLPDGSKFFVTPDGRYLDPEEFIGSKTTGGVQYVSTGDDRYQSGYSTLDTKTGVKTNYDMDGNVIGTSVQPESTLAS